MDSIAKDGLGNSVHPHGSIFPILKEIDSRTNQMVGTGFFLTKIGHFVTAKHVIADVYDFNKGTQFAPIHAVHFVTPTEVLIRHITKIAIHPISDIAVGKMDFHVHNNTGKPLFNLVPTFSSIPPPMDSTLVTFAYPETDKIITKGKMGKIVGSLFTGKLIEHNEGPRDSVLVNWPHYVTSIDVKGGASGGPVFNQDGHVIGINCVGGLGDLSYIARVHELLEMAVPDFPLDGKGKLGDPRLEELVRKGIVLLSNSTPKNIEDGH